MSVTRIVDLKHLVEIASKDGVYGPELTRYTFKIVGLYAAHLEAKYRPLEQREAALDNLEYLLKSSNTLIYLPPVLGKQLAQALEHTRKADGSFTGSRTLDNVLKHLDLDALTAMQAMRARARKQMQARTNNNVRRNIRRHATELKQLLGEYADKLGIDCEKPVKLLFALIELSHLQDEEEG